jgi:FKBP-type peptidyl-prolyl cis-trans isomerase 2
LTEEHTPSQTKPRAQPAKTSRTKTVAPSPLIEKGDFVLVDLLGRAQEDNRLFETTKAEVAKKEGVFQDDEVYQPRLVVVGQGYVVPGIDEALLGMKAGETKQLVLPPEKAFGIRDPKQVRIVPRGRLKSDEKVVRGMRIRLGNQYGIVRHVGGGRVTVDFNSPLAGHTVQYEISVIQKLTKPQEKLDAFIRRRFAGLDPKSINVSTRGSTVTVTITADVRVLLNQALPIQKLGLTHDIETHLKDSYSKVLFIEEWTVGSPKPATP